MTDPQPRQTGGVGPGCLVPVLVGVSAALTAGQRAGWGWAIAAGVASTLVAAFMYDAQERLWAPIERRLRNTRLFEAGAVLWVVVWVAAMIALAIWPRWAWAR